MVGIGHQGGGGQHGPGLLQRIEPDFDDRHAQDARAVVNGVRCKVPGLVAAANGKVAGGPPGQGLQVVGAVRHAFAPQAVVGLGQVAGGQHGAAHVQHKHRRAAQVGVEAGQVVVGRGDVGGGRVGQQAHHQRVELDGGGHGFEPAHPCLDDGGKQVQPGVGGFAQAGGAGFEAALVHPHAHQHHEQHRRQGQQRTQQGLPGPGRLADGLVGGKGLGGDGGVPGVWRSQGRAVGRLRFRLRFSVAGFCSGSLWRVASGLRGCRRIRSFCSLPRCGPCP